MLARRSPLVTWPVKDPLASWGLPALAGTARRAVCSVTGSATQPPVINWIDETASSGSVRGRPHLRQLDRDDDRGRRCSAWNPHPGLRGDQSATGTAGAGGKPGSARSSSRSPSSGSSFPGLLEPRGRSEQPVGALPGRREGVSTRGVDAQVKVHGASTGCRTARPPSWPGPWTSAPIVPENADAAPGAIDRLG